MTRRAGICELQKFGSARMSNSAGGTIDAKNESGHFYSGDVFERLLLKKLAISEGILFNQV